MASSTPCPMRKLPSTTRAMQTPGGTIAHQAPDDTAVCRKAFWMIVPHETRSGSPRPMKASAASKNTAEATVSTVWATSNGATWGRMWWRMM